MNTSQQVNEISKALLAVQKGLEPVVKDCSNDFVGNRYASLGAVMAECLPHLNANGIVLTQSPGLAPEWLGSGYMSLTTTLTHAKSGQWISGDTILPLQKNDPQGMGSAISYARRYAIQAMLGMVAEDDDAEAAMPRQAQPQPRKQAPSEPAQPQRPAGGAGLPALDGVQYMEGTVDGNRVIVASGKGVYQNREGLKMHGFRFSREAKQWYKEQAGGRQNDGPPVPEYVDTTDYAVDDCPF